MHLLTVLPKFVHVYKSLCLHAQLFNMWVGEGKQNLQFYFGNTMEYVNIYMVIYVCIIIFPIHTFLIMYIHKYMHIHKYNLQLWFTISLVLWIYIFIFPVFISEIIKGFFTVF